jgi:ribA/ribD-fused uncharacterized protein
MNLVDAEIVSSTGDLFMPIYFYVAREQPYGCFSNFSPHGIELDGAWWPTVEHYFQAQKFVGTPQAEAIRRARSPKDAKNMGHDRRFSLRADWEEVKIDVMRRAVLRKFESHEELREQLLTTGDELIVENAPTDYFWGCGVNGSGQNWLGRVLMETREILRARVDSARIAGEVSSEEKAPAAPRQGPR